MTTTVTDPHQLAVPESIAAAAGLKAGSLVEWIPTDEKGVVKLRVQDRAALAASLCGAGRKYLKPGDDPIADLIAERSREG